MCAFSWIGDVLKVVWGFLININSGQIQVVIALAAIWLAYKGYKKVLKQISMAQDQFKESEIQTKHFANQVKEVAKQTQIAAKQFENSNVQIQELIEHRNLVLEIRKSELKSDCIDLSIKAIAGIQEAVEILQKGINIVNGRLELLKSDIEVEVWLQSNLEAMTKELNDLRERLTVLIRLSGEIATSEDDRKKEELEKELMTIKMIYLRSVRSKCIYQDLIKVIEREMPLPRL